MYSKIYHKTYQNDLTKITTKMRKIIYLLMALLLSPNLFAQTRPFITTWNLATAGSAVTGSTTQLSFGVGTAGTVNYTWTTVPAGTTGSGMFTGTTATITSLPAGATIELSIDPANFQRININNGSDKSRLTDVKQWGDVVWTSMENAFHGCNNLLSIAIDIPNFSGVANMSSMFRDCRFYNQI